jgi:hypothetical protein
VKRNIPLLLFSLIILLGCSKNESLTRDTGSANLKPAGSGVFLNRSKQSGTLTVIPSTEIEIANEIYPDLTPQSGADKVYNQLNGNFDINIPVYFKSTSKTNFIFQCLLDNIHGANNDKAISVVMASPSYDSIYALAGVSTNGGTLKEMLYPSLSGVDSMFAWEDVSKVGKDSTAFIVRLSRRNEVLNVSIFAAPFFAGIGFNEVYNENFAVNNKGRISLQWVSQPLEMNTMERASFDFFNLLLEFSWLDEVTFYKQIKLD